MSDFNGEVEDVLGSTIRVGDTVAGAFRIGNVAVLRVGTVLGFAERANRLTVRVQWQHSSRSYEGEIVGAIEADLHRFVKINAPQSAESITALNDSVPVVNP